MEDSILSRARELGETGCLKIIKKECRIQAIKRWGGEGRFCIYKSHSSKKDEKLWQTVPEMVKKRLDEEIELIRDRRCAQDLWLAKILCAKAEKWKYTTWSRGGVEASFVAFLLGITSNNPLPPHYYCGHCHTMEEGKGVYVGRDLSGKSCSGCGQSYVIGNGFGIEAEEFFGGNNSCSIELDMQEDCIKRLREDVFPDVEPGQDGELQYGRITMKAHRDTDLLRQIGSRTQVSWWGYEKQTYENVLCEQFSPMGVSVFESEAIRSRLREKKPKRIGDLIRLMQETYSAKGSCFMKAQAVSDCMMGLDLAGYKLYCPKAFYDAYFDVYADDVRDRPERYRTLQEERERVGDGMEFKKMREKFERYYNERGELGVLFSVNYGSGWTGAGDTGDYSRALDRRIIEKFMERVPVEEFVAYVESLGYGDIYLDEGSYRDLRLTFLPAGTLFFIHGYDGFETIETLDSMHVIKA